MGHDFAKLGNKTHCVREVVALDAKLVVISNFDTRCHYILKILVTLDH